MTRLDATFTVQSFQPTSWSPPAEPEVAMAFGEAEMSKTFAGGLEGRSTTRFLGGMSEDQSEGAYVAVEWFEGSVGGRSGTCLILHSQLVQPASAGPGPQPWLHVVPGSGTGELTGLSAAGGMAVDDDGTHRIWLDVVEPA